MHERSTLIAENSVKVLGEEASSVTFAAYPLLMQNQSKIFFSLGLTEHRFWGVILLPYLLERIADSPILKIAENLHGKEQTKTIELSAAEKQVLKLVNEYSEKSLFKLFSVQKNQKEFIAQLSAEQYSNHIRPYIEKRLLKCFNLLKDSGIPIYQQRLKLNNLYEEERLEVDPEPAKTLFTFERNEEGTRYSLAITFRQEEVRLGKTTTIITNSPCLINTGKRIIFVEETDGKKLQPFLSKDFIAIARSSEKQYFASFVLNTIKKYQVRAVGFTIKRDESPFTTNLSIEENLAGDPMACLRFCYGNSTYFANSTTEPKVTLTYKGEVPVFDKQERNFAEEQRLIAGVERAGLHNVDGPFFFPSGVESKSGIRELMLAIYDGWSQLTGLGIKVDQKVNGHKLFMGSPKLEIRFTTHADGFMATGGLHLNNQQIPLGALKKMLTKDANSIITPEGSVVYLSDEVLEKLKPILFFGKEEEGGIKISRHHFQLVDDNLEVGSEDLAQLKSFDRLPELVGKALPVGLNATLRSYQMEGFAWLKYLQMNGFGGCLADDMGLGKTLQTLAFLLWCKQNIRQPLLTKTSKPEQQNLFASANEAEVTSGKAPTSLIVMPTSLIHSWKAEVRKFTPDLTVYEHVGLGRTREVNQLAKYDIVLTTYGILRNDMDMLSRFRFFYAILDESQMIKNPDSKGYRAAMQLNAENKLVITGTPIENSLIDLWSQMNVINHGILGNRKFYEDQFANSLNVGVSAIQEKRLKSIIAPFLLRRTKEEVAKDLPEKLENIVYCDMSEEQNDIYNSEKEAFKQNLIANLEPNGFSRNRMKIFQGLIRLRQAACHPSLFDDGFTGRSGKFEEVVRMIDSVVSEGHKVLVFSSFVKHLRLVEREIQEHQIPYLMLTGSSLNREELVKSFQHNDKIKVFLISLKAGGFGLNLTAADYVFLLDPWWNPASENQALDRAHRIGQDRKVFAYRFITSGTIEEKIMELQEKKSKLAETFINSNNPLKDLNRELLDALLG